MYACSLFHLAKRSEAESRYSSLQVLLAKGSTLTDRSCGLGVTLLILMSTWSGTGASTLTSGTAAGVGGALGSSSLVNSVS